jgi:lysozyme family protein
MSDGVTGKQGTGSAEPKVAPSSEARFLECVKFVLAREGGAHIDRDPNDPGGTTKYGIDQRDHPNVDVVNLTEAEAIEIYRHEAWDKARCAEMKAPWDLAVLDSAVNPGIGWVGTNLQKAVGAKVDGLIGPKTLAAVNAAGDQELINFLRARCTYYRKRPAKLNGKPFRDRFLDGWLNRVEILAEATLGSPAADRVMAA